MQSFEIESFEIEWWRVDGGGEIYFRKSKDLEDKIESISAQTFSIWRAVHTEGEWIQCENGLWLPTQYMDLIEIDPKCEYMSNRIKRNIERKSLIDEFSTIQPYMNGFNIDGWYDKPKEVVSEYYTDWVEELEKMLYVYGLPKTSKVQKLRKLMIKKSNVIFGSIPLIVDLMLDNNGKTTGEAYIEFKESTSSLEPGCIKNIVNTSDKYQLDKKHTLRTKRCRQRPSGTYNDCLKSYNYDGRLWFSIPSIEEIEENERKDKEYEDKFGHLSGEIADPNWIECEVTENIINEYWTKMNSTMNEFNYENGEKCGTIPKSVEKNDVEYKLINFSSHAFVCDEPMCQAMFHKADYEDGGAMGAFVYTRLPIYTSREFKGINDGLEDLCYVCITK